MKKIYLIYRIIRKRFVKSLFHLPKNQQKNWRDILLLTQVCTLFLIYFYTIMSANCKCRKSKYFFPWNDDQNIWKKPKHRANWSEKKLHSLQWEEAKTLQLNFRFRSCEDEFRILRENILLFNIHEFTKNIYF